MELSENVDQLTEEIRHHAPHESAKLIENMPTEIAVAILLDINRLTARQIVHQLKAETRDALLAAFPDETAKKWIEMESYSAETIGSLMIMPVAVFRSHMTVRETIEDLRSLTQRDFITYGYVTSEDNKLKGILIFRDLMLASPDQLIDEVMHKDLFTLRPETKLTDAMKLVLNRHYPVYPVCDESGHLVGLLRGQALFEARAIEISAQAGSMVGVQAGERLSTPLKRSLKMRHPWLQFNLLTAFIAAAVVGYFEDTLNSVVILAAFLPVLAGQSGNTGCQALAVCLRGLTLGDIKEGQSRKLVVKEGLLGLFNGFLVGLIAGLGMFVYASMQDNPAALMLGVVVVVAMVVSCIVSGIAGATIPLILRKCGADPATASSIFLTTATDVVSMGSFLGLATWLIV